MKFNNPSKVLISKYFIYISQPYPKILYLFRFLLGNPPDNLYSGKKAIPANLQILIETLLEKKCHAPSRRAI